MTLSALPFDDLRSDAGYPNRPHTGAVALGPYRRHRAYSLGRHFAVVPTLVALFASRADLRLENLALRQQRAVLQRKNPGPTFSRSTAFSGWLCATGGPKGARRSPSFSPQP
jgi:hypothetical protein